MLYELLFAWADAYNSVVNSYNAHDGAGGSVLNTDPSPNPNTHPTPNNPDPTPQYPKSYAQLIPKPRSPVLIDSPRFHHYAQFIICTTNRCWW